VGDELDKAEEDPSNDKKQERDGIPRMPTKPTEKQGGSVDGMKAAEKTNGRAVTDQHRADDTSHTLRQRGEQKPRTSKPAAAEKSDKYQKKFCCCIIM